MKVKDLRTALTELDGELEVYCEKEWERERLLKLAGTAVRRIEDVDHATPDSSFHWTEQVVLEDDDFEPIALDSSEGRPGVVLLLA